jgi:hypothetical protein
MGYLKFISVSFGGFSFFFIPLFPHLVEWVFEGAAGFLHVLDDRDGIFLSLFTFYVVWFTPSKCSSRFTGWRQIIFLAFFFVLKDLASLLILGSVYSFGGMYSTYIQPGRDGRWPHDDWRGGMVCGHRSVISHEWKTHQHGKFRPGRGILYSNFGGPQSFGMGNVILTAVT